jgi:hypothetical protein
MVTRIANKRFYDNVSMGCAKPDEAGAEAVADGTIFLTFHDNDNDEVHLVPVAEANMEQYIRLIRQTIAGQKIVVPGPGEIPK